MKKYILLIVAIIHVYCAHGQHKLYKSDGNEYELNRVFSKLEFAPVIVSKGQIDSTVSKVFPAVGILAVAGPLIQLAFKLAAPDVEKKKLEYLKTISFSAVNALPTYKIIPTLRFSRLGYNHVSSNNNIDSTEIFSFNLVPKFVTHPFKLQSNVFFYELEDFKINYCEALINKKRPVLDLTCELHVVGVDSTGKQASYNAGIFSLQYINTEEGVVNFIPTKIVSSLLDRNMAVVEVRATVIQTNSHAITFDNWINKLFTSGEELNGVLSKLAEKLPNEK